MEISRHPSSPELAPLVRHVLVLKAADFTINALLPSETLTLVVRLSGSIFDVSHGANEPIPRVALTGARDFPRSVAYAPGTETLLVEFQPGAARKFLNVPQTELFGRTLSARDLFNDADVDRLEYRLLTAAEPERLRIIQDFVLSAVSEVQPHPAVDRALALIRRSGGTLSVRRLVESVGTNKDTLEKRFLQELGFGPKTFLRISRMKRVLASIDGTESLGALAAQFAFSDQSHFNHEFRAMVGLAPREYVIQGTRW